MPNVVVGTGSDVNIKIPDEVFDAVDWNGEYTTVAGSLDDAGLPSWLKYDEKRIHSADGRLLTMKAAIKSRYMLWTNPEIQLF